MRRESPRIRNLAMLVVGYGVAHRLFEFTWKGQLRVLYPSALEYQSILSSVSMATGVASIVMIGVASLVFHRFGWGVATALTPISMLVTGGVFFSLSIAGLMPGAASIATAGVMMGAVAQVRTQSAARRHRLVRHLLLRSSGGLCSRTLRTSDSKREFDPNRSLEEDSSPGSSKSWSLVVRVDSVNT